MNRMRRLIPQSAYARNVLTLITGTTLAQAISIAISPILTRLYGPEEFGLAALYVSCVAVLSLIATGRYELAITLPATDEEAAHIVTFTLKISALIAASLYAPIIFFGETVAGWMGNTSLAPWFYLLPLSIVVTSAFNVLQYWCNRRSQYRLMSTNRVQNTVFSSAFNLAMGTGKISGGLILGPVLGQALAAGFIGRRVWRQSGSLLSTTTKAGEQKMAKRYSDHPKHIAPAQLIGIVAVQIPVFLIGGVYSLAVLGFFNIAYQMVSLPSGLVANAIGDVYRQRISAAYSERGEFVSVFLDTLKKTTLLALPPFVIIYCIAPDLFELVFGPTWRTAGEYAQILVVGAFFQFIFTPIDKGAVVVGATRYIFIWHLLRLSLFLVLYIFVNSAGIDIKTALWVFVLINSFLYIFDGCVEFRMAKNGK